MVNRRVVKREERQSVSSPPADRAGTPSAQQRVARESAPKRRVSTSKCRHTHTAFVCTLHLSAFECVNADMRTLNLGALGGTRCHFDPDTCAPRCCSTELKHARQHATELNHARQHATELNHARQHVTELKHAREHATELKHAREH